MYVKMLVQGYIDRLKKSNEHYEAQLITIDEVKFEDKEKKEADVKVPPAFAAIFKLVHVAQKVEK